jgi:hypothetical protein
VGTKLALAALGGALAGAVVAYYVTVAGCKARVVSGATSAAAGLGGDSSVQAAVRNLVTIAVSQ